jgi:hypothetical protein
MQDHSTQLVDQHKQHQQQEQFNTEDNHQFNNHNNEPQNQIYLNENEVPPNYQSNNHWSQSILYYDSIAIGS